MSHDIECCDALNATAVSTADVDGDGDQDVLSTSAGDDTVAWYQNDGKGSFDPLVITDRADGANFVATADVDGDGDLDVLSSSYYDRKIAWYQNTDGKGDFGEQRVITRQVAGAGSVATADVDGDGDQDALSASANSFESKVAWYENTDGKGGFGPQKIITTQAIGAKIVAAADLDGDGDQDVLSASRYDDKIAWYENTDGKGGFGSQRVITTQADWARFVATADVDGDGDLDVLSASSIDDKVAWYENTDGKGRFGHQQVISTGVDGAFSVATADVDGDSDLDVVSASYADDTVAWYENTDGKGKFGPQQFITIQADGANSVAVTDVDGDGDQDVVSSSYYDHRIAWYENLSPLRLVGDSNGDGVFNSSDLVVVFQAGEYEDDIAGNSTFEEGDWDGNGDFNSRDLVLAFQIGNYVSAAKFAASVDWLLAETNDKTSRAKPRHMSLDVTNGVFDAWWTE
jgi:hypothetical protein